MALAYTPATRSSSNTPQPKGNRSKARAGGGLMMSINRKATNATAAGTHTDPPADSGSSTSARAWPAHSSMTHWRGSRRPKAASANGPNATQATDATTAKAPMAAATTQTERPADQAKATKTTHGTSDPQVPGTQGR